jgi:hypothetical protein
MKNNIREQILKCGNACTKRKTSKESTFAELEAVLFTWYQKARGSNIPVDGTILKEKAKIIAAKLNIDCFSASSGWLSRFKDRHGLVFKKLAGESGEVSIKITDAWLESLPSLLEGYKPRDVYNADETGLFFNVLPGRTLAYKGETCHGGKHSKDRLTVLLCVNRDGSDKQVPIVIGKSSKPRCFKDVKKLTQQTIQNCFRKAGYKYQSNGNEMANNDDDDDDFGQDWEELCRAQKYVSVDCIVATSGVSTVEEL